MASVSYAERRSNEKLRKRLLKELRDLDRGSNIAYGMAIYDKGASVRKLERKKAELSARLAAMVV